jgi:hypothetical protein
LPDRFQNRERTNILPQDDMRQRKHRMTGKCKALFASRVFRMAASFPILCCFGYLVLAASALAQQVSREQEIGELRLGQRVKVDDGTCPAGQIKEVSGTKITPTGIVRSRKCIPRLGPKRK